MGPVLWHPDGEDLGTRKWHMGLCLFGVVLNPFPYGCSGTTYTNRSQTESVCWGQAVNVTLAGSISASLCLH